MPEVKFAIKEINQKDRNGFSIKWEEEVKRKREFNFLADPASNYYAFEDKDITFDELITEPGMRRSVGVIFSGDHTPRKLMLHMDSFEVVFDQEKEGVLIRHEYRFRNRSTEAGIKVGENRSLELEDQAMGQFTSFLNTEETGVKIYQIEDKTTKESLCSVVIFAGKTYVITYNYEADPWIYRLSLNKFTEEELLNPIQKLNQGILDYGEGERDPKKLIEKFGLMMSLINRRMWVYSPKLFLAEVGEEFRKYLEPFSSS